MDDLFDFKEVKEVPHFTDENGFTYYLHKKSDKKWKVIKTGSDYVVAKYDVDFMLGKWICDCPAGYKGNKCKHSTWVSILDKVI